MASSVVAVPGSGAPGHGAGRERLPRVSVVIPCCNYGRYLAAAVTSVTGQRGVDVDVIVIDDCSSDGSQVVARELADADPRVRAVFHRMNLGHITTYNEGVAQVEGDYVVLLSADDQLAPGSLRRATALMEAHPSVGFVYGDTLRFSGEEAPAPSHGVPVVTVWDGPSWLEERCRVVANVIYSAEVVMRTAVQHAIGPYSAGLPHTADFEMWLRAAAVADVGHVGGVTQAFYRDHPDALHHRLCPRPLDDLRARYEAMAAVVGPGSTVPGAARLFALARSSVADQARQLDGRLATTAVQSWELEAFAARVAAGMRATEPA